MKRVVSFCLLFCLVLIVSAARAQVPEATALTTNKVITIDGVIDPNEWKGVDPIWVNRDTGIDTTGTPSGDADLSYNLYIAHDGETLYLGFDISDENIQADSGTSTWDDDCVEIFGDADNQGTTQTNDGMGFQLLITTDGRTDGGDQAALGLTGDEWFATQVKGTGDGWVCEVAIPFTSFDTGGGTPLAVGDRIGFTVNVDDDDDGAGREGQLWWYAVSGDSWDNQEQWGDLVISAELASTVSAGPDQRVVAGTTVTLTGKGPDDTTSFTWTQTGGQEHHVATLQPSPNQAEVQFDTPVVEIGFILTFELTVVSTSEGTVTDDVQITVLAPNEPRVVPGNFRTFVKHLGIRLEWDAILDADDYGVGLKFGTMYLWFWTDDAYYDLGNLSPGQETIVVVKARNSYGEGVESEEIIFTPMANVALPGEQGGPHPPSEQVYVVSHYNIASMNDAVIEDDSNDSWDGLYKQEDYWGYLWPQAVYMDQVVYFAGNVFSDGGWFTTLKVQYTPDGASWLDVPMSTAPEYNLADEQKGRRSNERFDISIPTLRGTGIRIYGTPGGTASFTSIAELEVYGLQTRNPLIVQGVDKEVPERRGHPHV